MKTNRFTRMIAPALVLAVFPLVSGCYFQARGVVAPPRVAINATPPAPPAGRVVVHATVPAPPSFIVTTSTRTAPARPATPPAAVATAAPAPAPSTEPPSSTASLTYNAPPTLTAVTTASGSARADISLGAGPSIAVAVPSPPPTPPAVATETIPAPRPGSIWIPGHYVYLDTSWIWRAGQWVAAEDDVVWVEPEYDHGRRVWAPGRFETRQIRDDRMRPEPRPQDLLPVEAPNAVSQYAAPPPTPSLSINAGASLSVQASARAR